MNNQDVLFSKVHSEARRSVRPGWVNSEDILAAVCMVADIEAAYGLSYQGVRQAITDGRLVVKANETGRTDITTWANVEAVWGARPDRYLLYLEDDGAYIYTVPVIKGGEATPLIRFDRPSQALTYLKDACGVQRTEAVAVFDRTLAEGVADD